MRPRSGHHLVEILSKIADSVKNARPSLNLEGHWTPGHSDIFGNELVDGEAKWAAAGRSSATKLLPRALRKRLPLSAAARKQAYRKRADEVAGQMWSESPRYDRLAMRDLRMKRPLRFFQKAAIKLSRRQQSLLVQLRTGHIGLNHHLHRIGRALVPDCPHCEGVSETVVHFLLKCPNYSDERKALQPARRERSVAELITNPGAFKWVLSYVDATRRLSAVFGEGAYVA